MKYRCPNKECPFYKRQKKSWKIQGSSASIPVNCPECGAELVKIFRAKAKGSRFERKIADLINTLWCLTGRQRAKRMILSGGAEGWEGDIANLPEPIIKWTIEAKNHKSPSIGAFWAQAEWAAEKLGKEPIVIFHLKGNYKFTVGKGKYKKIFYREVDEDLIVRKLRSELKDQVLLEGKSNG